MSWIGPAACAAGVGAPDGRRAYVTMGLVFTSMMTAPPALWLRSPKADARAAGQLGREGMIDAGLVGGDARITIRRESPDDVGFREIFVSIDGEPVAILKSGETFTAEIPAGPHRLRAH